MSTAFRPIGPEDVIRVRGKHLIKSDGTRFFVRGIAFPTPPPPPDDEDDDSDHGDDDNHISSSSSSSVYGYDPEAWLAVLRQLRYDLSINFNVIRLYRLRPDLIDYTEFLVGAASMGVYVIVPLTSDRDDGVLDRDMPAPGCYTRQLYDFGTLALGELYMNHPNVLAGVVGNEVMDGEGAAWMAAPCVRAYSRDLKYFMNSMISTSSTTTKTKTTSTTETTTTTETSSPRRGAPIPLVYASQDSSPMGGAALDKDESLRLTTDYLTCDSSSSMSMSMSGEEEDERGKRGGRGGGGGGAVDIMGINVESWCSSTQSYTNNVDGTPGPYYHLHESLRNASAPIIFTEMGCPHSQYDRDDPIRRKQNGGTRTWADVSVVSNEMADAWSGYVAYAYDGPPDFDMMSGGPWNGKDVLNPTSDMYNFKMRVNEEEEEEDDATMPRSVGTTTTTEYYDDYDYDDYASFPPRRRCDEVEAELLSCCDVRVLDDDAMPSYFRMHDEAEDATDDRYSHRSPSRYAVAAAATVALALYLTIRRALPRQQQHPIRRNGDDAGSSKYGSIALS